VPPGMIDSFTTLASVLLAMLTVRIHSHSVASALKGGEEGIRIHSLHPVGLEPKTHMGPHRPVGPYRKHS
jgi:hypothetical protein